MLNEAAETRLCPGAARVKHRSGASVSWALHDLLLSPDPPESDERHL